MRYRIVVLLSFILLASAFLMPGSTSARQMVPHAQVKPADSYGGVAIQRWGGGTQAVSSKFWIDDPGVGADAYWQRWVELDSISNNVLQWYLDFGVEKVGSNAVGGHCGYGRHFFIYDSAIGANTCFPLYTDDTNKAFPFQIYKDRSSGDMEFKIFGGLSDMPCSSGPCSDATRTDRTWNRIQLVEVIHATYTGHFVYGGSWTDNYWMGNYNWALQNVDGVTIPGNPPQMGWLEGRNSDGSSYSYPPSVIAGGNLASCDYDSFDTLCYWRS